MIDSRLEIMRLVADRVVTPEEGLLLFEALRIGQSEGYGPEVASGAAVAARTAEPRPDASGPEAVPACKPDTEYHLARGNSVRLPAGTVLRIHGASDSEPSSARAEAGTPPHGVALRVGPGSHVRVIQGRGVTLRLSGGEAAVRWAGGMLLLEIPGALSRLEVLSMDGNAGIAGDPGPMFMDGIQGKVSVRGARSPFRICGIGGGVKMTALQLASGSSLVEQVLGDVEIEAAAGASIAAEASAIEDLLVLEEVVHLSRKSQQLRGYWRIGAGAARLAIRSVNGSVRLRSAPAPGSRAARKGALP